MNYLDGKHYIITLLFSKGNYTEDIIKYYIISDNNPLQNKEINKYLSKWKKEFFYEFGDTEDKPRADIYMQKSMEYLEKNLIVYIMIGYKII